MSHMSPSSLKTSNIGPVFPGRKNKNNFLKDFKTNMWRVCDAGAVAAIRRYLYAPPSLLQEQQKELLTVMRLIRQDLSVYGYSRDWGFLVSENRYWSNTSTLYKCTKCQNQGRSTRYRITKIAVMYYIMRMCDPCHVTSLFSLSRHMNQ